MESNPALDPIVHTSESVLMRSEVLQPTLWRTCRVIANQTRLEIFRFLVQHPDLPLGNVTRISNSPKVNISSDAFWDRRVRSRIPAIDGAVDEILAALQQLSIHDIQEYRRFLIIRSRAFQEFPRPLV